MQLAHTGEGTFLGGGGPRLPLFSPVPPTAGSASEMLPCGKHCTWTRAHPWMRS